MILDFIPRYWGRIRCAIDKICKRIQFIMHLSTFYFLLPSFRTVNASTWCLLTTRCDCRQISQCLVTMFTGSSGWKVFKAPEVHGILDEHGKLIKITPNCRDKFIWKCRSSCFASTSISRPLNSTWPVSTILENQNKSNVRNKPGRSCRKIQPAWEIRWTWESGTCVRLCAEMKLHNQDT